MTLSAGDQIIITHKENASSGYEWKALQISGLNKWNKMPLTGGNFINAAQRIDKLDDGGTNYLFVPYTLNQKTAVVLTEDDAAKINETRGFTIWGAGYTVTKIEVRTADYSDDKSITLSYAGDSADSGKDFIADIGFTGFDSIPETVEVYYFDEQGERWNWPCEVSDGKVKLFCHIPGNVDLYVACGFVKSNTIKVNMIELFNGIYAGNAEGGDDITDLLYMVEYEEYLWKKTVSDGVYSYWAGRVQFDGNTLTLTNECVLEDSDNAGITGENMHDFSDAFGFLDFTVTANWSEADGTITFNTYSYFDSGTGQQEEMPVNILFTKQQ